MVDKTLELHNYLKENLELLKLEKKELVVALKQRERALKQLEELQNTQGIKLNYEIDENMLLSMGKLEKIEKEIKFTKSMLRRIESVFSMYDMEIIKSEDIEGVEEV